MVGDGQGQRGRHGEAWERKKRWWKVGGGRRKEDKPAGRGHRTRRKKTGGHAIPYCMTGHTIG
jgi:hypothetical protein